MTTPSVFSEYRPSSREWDVGTFPVKKFKAQNGSELKILYGDKIVQRVLKLEYRNMNDVNVEKFMEHYIANKGTYGNFTFDLNAENGVFAGWTGGLDTLNYNGNTIKRTVKWSYNSSPVIKSVFKGISTINIELVATP